MSLRFQGCLPIDFWGEWLLTAGYLINRTPSSVVDGNTPYSVLYGHDPTYDCLCVFGSLSYAHKQGSQETNLIVGVDGAFLWDIQMRKRGGLCMT